MGSARQPTSRRRQPRRSVRSTMGSPPSQKRSLSYRRTSHFQRRYASTGFALATPHRIVNMPRISCPDADNEDPQPAVIEERNGDIEFRVVNNDNERESLIILTGLKCI